MSIRLWLHDSRKCVHCGGTAPLAFRTITKGLADGCVLTVENVPVYRCETCGRETMNLSVRAFIENHAQRVVDEVGGPGTECLVSIKLDAVTEKETALDDAVRDGTAYSVVFV